MSETPTPVTPTPGKLDVIKRLIGPALAAVLVTGTFIGLSHLRRQEPLTPVAKVETPAPPVAAPPAPVPPAPPAPAPIVKVEQPSTPAAAPKAAKAAPKAKPKRVGLAAKKPRSTACDPVHQPWWKCLRA